MVIALIIVFVVAADDDEPAPADNGTGEDGPAGDGDRENTEMPGMNEEVTHDGMVFTVTQVETDVSSVEGARPVDEYVIVHIDVASDTGSIETFWTDEQHVYTLDGSQVSEDYDATWDLDSSGHSHDLAANGTPESLQIAFDVPDGDELSHIGLSTQTLGGNEVEVDLTG